VGLISFGGHPTVILEAGLNDFSVIWTAVQRMVATFARVCSYDRAGFGWSEPSPQPRTRIEAGGGRQWPDCLRPRISILHAWND
jgi:pimeloyl-ACP methyl ester carboxylesterase